jgi:hypothetical protein
LTPQSPISHSYQGQDRFVVETLTGLRGGYFLDSGASDGVHGSNTLLLESEFGWTGICVEPNSEMFRWLVRSRACVCVNCCLYDRGGDVEFFESAGVLGGIIAEYNPGLLQQARDLVASQFGPGHQVTVAKPARTIRSILREHDAPHLIDYWSLDTEGSELAILESFPFDEYAVRVLTVEHNGTPDRWRIRQLLESRGYRRVREMGIDDAYVLGGSRLRPAWRSWAWSRAS